VNKARLSLKLCSGCRK